MTPHLRALQRKPPPARRETVFPFSVAAVRHLTELDLDVPVTFFVGQNGSGKSTLLEALALAAGLPTVGSGEAAADETLAPQRELARTLRLVWRRRTHRGFFLRAEDFFGFARRVSALRAELEGRMAEVEGEYRDRSPYAKGLAQGPLRASLHEMEARYGVNLDARSHGESFLKLFQSRFVPGGLYLMDEPEAPLSPHSQLAFLALLDDMVRHDAQFIIATHSPILLAFPEARIYSFDATPVAAVAYETLEHVSVMRDFLNAPERYLRRLRGDGAG